MYGSRNKIPSKKSRQQRCAEGFNSGVKVLITSKMYQELKWLNRSERVQNTATIEECAG
jgi:hypothetical protein